ncbi:MAG: flippase-like domain-containing protein [Candidatus Nomurabacteria bacterium]|jgi:uncharacterized protein (TIRG00374 family)|nr:flippase-like domain-containing protein [Candidatus Nomurabacteria bacterium]
MENTRRKKHGFKFWLNVVTLVAVILLVWFSREDLLQAWRLLGQVDFWWLILLVPLQVIVYYSMSEIGMSYLEKRRQMKKQHWWTKAIFSLELNFVNHVLPSAGASGFSYGLWRMKNFGVDKVHATMSQLIRTIISFAAFIPLLLIASFWVSITNKASGSLVMIAVGASVLLIMVLFFGSYLISNRQQMLNFGHWATRAINRVVYHITFKRARRQVLSVERAEKVFSELNDDYVKLMREKKVLKWPFLWGIIWILADVAMFEITFVAMGTFVDPMVLLLAYGASCVAGFFVLTPGGVGAYEAAFILVLISNGVGGDVASAGTLLTRVILVIGTLLSGYYFYHKAINRKELPPDDTPSLAARRGRDR